MMAMSDTNPMSQPVQRRQRMMQRDADRLFSLGWLRRQAWKELQALADKAMAADEGEFSSTVQDSPEADFALQYILSFRSSLEAIKKIWKNPIGRNPEDELKEKRNDLIEKFASLGIINGFEGIKEDNDNWRRFARRIKGEDTQRFFGLLDEISIITDILNGQGSRYEQKEDYTNHGNTNEEIGIPGEPSAKEEEKLNYFAPTKNLQELLKMGWLKELRTKEEYDEQWTDNFIAGLMGSEWKDNIARDWAIKGKREKKTQIKGHIIGLLVDAGVIKGSYQSVAAQAGVTDNDRTFARYMGEGKKQPFSGWVEEYVTGEKEE